MALNKSSVNINFSQGLDLKTDPFQVQVGKFLSLENSVFNKAGQLTKRNGYTPLTPLPDATSKYVTTFNGNLTAIGSELNAYSQSTNQWINKGKLQPADISVLSTYRSNTNQTQADSAMAPNGLVCTAFTDSKPSGVVHAYVVTNSLTGQNIVPYTLLSTANTTYGTPRVFVVGNYFIILFTTEVVSTYHLQYISISTINPTVVTTPADIASSYVPASTLAFDGYVIGTKLFIAYNTTSGGQSVKVTYITATNGTPVTPITFSSRIATMFGMTADITNTSNPILYIAWYDSASSTGYIAATNQNLNQVLAPTEFITSGTILNLTLTAQNAIATVYYEVSHTYAYDSSIHTNFIETNTITQAGVVGTASTLVRSLGLASKAFIVNSVSYFLGIYNSTFQPTYFLINSLGQVITRIAYENGGQYLTLGLPNITVNGTIVNIAYLYKDLLQAINSTQGVANAAGVYTQTGINLLTVNLSATIITTGEIGNTLNISGGFVASYDGVIAVEQGFFLWPDYVEATPGTSGGTMTDQQYYYQVTYEWTDNQGNLFRSAPSIPVGALVSGGGGLGSVLLNIPTLRLTYKIANPVSIVVYRWSAAQQVYYQVTSITSPLLNDPTVDYISYTDTLPDSAIIGNNIIYTTGGVLEDIAPPSSKLLTLFNNRLWLVDSEDTNLLWFSKQVIESTPVEMSDLLTLYVAPTTSAQGSTGPITAISPMDDKLIIFKQNALGYINGIGPDNTGANSQYSDFILINSVVGCNQQQSIVFMPQGLMFQSGKGIWLLGRDLSTSYIGAPVESLTQGAIVLSAVNVPETNQVRFTLNSGITLMYDYYYGQWGSFVNIPATYSTIYEDLHTYINSYGAVFQESPGSYLDDTSPVLMSFTTSWLNLAGLQGYERLYYFLLLGQYITPFNLDVQLAYNYNPSITQATTVTPDNFAQPWGGENLWGSGGSWGGTEVAGWESSASVFEARVFPTQQKCESFQITINEVYNNSLGQAAGAGLTLSGLNLIIGMKKNARTSRASRNFG